METAQEQETSSQHSLTVWEETQARNAHHRALILRILIDHPDGLTTQQVIAEEQEYFGYTFLTDNRLRELVQKGWVKKTDDTPCKWQRTSEVESK